MKTKTWLDMEDLVQMIPIGKVIKTSEMNRIVNEFNAGTITLDQVKKAIKSTKNVSLRTFLGYND